MQEDPAKALTDAERLKRQRMEEEESERSQRMLLEQVGVNACGGEPAPVGLTRLCSAFEGVSTSGAGTDSTILPAHCAATCLHCTACVCVRVCRWRAPVRLHAWMTLPEGSLWTRSSSGRRQMSRSRSASLQQQQPRRWQQRQTSSSCGRRQQHPHCLATMKVRHRLGECSLCLAAPVLVRCCDVVRGDVMCHLRQVSCM